MTTIAKEIAAHISNLPSLDTIKAELLAISVGYHGWAAGIPVSRVNLEVGTTYQPEQLPHWEIGGEHYRRVEWAAVRVQRDALVKDLTVHTHV